MFCIPLFVFFLLVIVLCVPEHLSSPGFLVGFVLLDLKFDVYVL